MHGRITYITEDEQYKFKGAILGEDGRTYKFNSGNWVNKNLCLGDLHEEQEVEFELKAPNQYGSFSRSLSVFRARSWNSGIIGKALSRRIIKGALVILYTLKPIRSRGC